MPCEFTGFLRKRSESDRLPFRQGLKLGHSTPCRIGRGYIIKSGSASNFPETGNRTDIPVGVAIFDEYMENEREAFAQKLDAVRAESGRAVGGQEELVDRMLLGLLCNGHVLLEGVPGIAKTLTATSLAKAVQAEFSRIQFTPDLLPGDLTGPLVYNPKDHTFTAEKGPVFANLLLADEINRAPAKVQSALLEAMQEKQVTLGKDT